MRKLFISTVIHSGILIGFLSCKEEISPLTPPKDPICQAPPIEKNIIGTWRFNNGRTGTVSFDANKNIIDPDSLFANTIDVGGRVIAKRYDFVSKNISPTESKRMLLVRQIAKNGEAGTYYTIEDNQCSKLNFALGGSVSVSLELTR